jgi:hypothetical protein
VAFCSCIESAKQLLKPIRRGKMPHRFPEEGSEHEKTRSRASRRVSLHITYAGPLPVGLLVSAVFGNGGPVFHAIGFSEGSIEDQRLLDQPSRLS